MIENIFEKVTLAETRTDLVRNIVSIRVSQDIFDDLSDSPDAWESAIRLELAAKPPFFISGQPVIDRPFEEARWHDAIEYPFRHWMRSRYSDGTFGVWYGADTIETTIHETVFHWQTALLRDAGFHQTGIKVERKIYTVRCDAALVDLRPSTHHFPALTAPDDYSLTQQIGAKLHREGHPGLISRSARSKGDVFAILNARVLSAPRYCCSLTYTTTAQGVDVEREPGTVWLSLVR